MVIVVSKSCETTPLKSFLGPPIDALLCSPHVTDLAVLDITPHPDAVWTKCDGNGSWSLSTPSKRQTRSIASDQVAQIFRGTARLLPGSGESVISGGDRHDVQWAVGGLNHPPVTHLPNMGKGLDIMSPPRC